MEDQIQQALDYLNKDNFDEAEKLLFKMKRENYLEPTINYYLGILFNKYNNPNRSNERAMEYFHHAISGEYVFENAYLQIALLEKNRNHALRIIKKGIEVFPESLELNETLLDLTEIQNRKEVYDEIIKRGVTSDKLNINMLLSCFELGKYDEATELSSKITVVETNLALITYLIQALSFYEIGNLNNAKKRFHFLINEDIKHELQYSPYIGLILCNLAQGEVGKAFELFEELPLDYHFNADIYLVSSFMFSFEKYMLDAFSQLEGRTKKTIILAKIRGLRGMYFSNFDSITTEKKMIKDLEYANKHIPSNIYFCENLKIISESKGRYFEAFEYAIQHINNSYDKYKEILTKYSNWAFINNADIEAVLEMTEYFIGKLQESKAHHEKYYETILKPLVERLFKENQYTNIIKVAEKVNLSKAKILFEVAYSYAQTKQLDFAKKYYEMYEDLYGATNATSNNLGVIYRSQDNLYKAQEMYTRAMELDPMDKTASNNYTNVTKQITELEKITKELERAASTFSNENAWLKGKVLSFSKFRNEDGYIVCPYKQLPQFLGVKELKANELVKELLEKKYLLKVIDHNINTTSSVYKVNPEVYKLIEQMEREFQKEFELISIVDNISTQQFEKLGYDQQLLNSVNKISSEELRYMIERDLNENIMALTTRSFKTSLIMSGSIIEAVLIDKISSNQIISYVLENGKNKKVTQMDLHELLYVANKEGFINIQLYHLSHAIRGFRNLIHPGVEQRKSALSVTEENATLAWGITRKIIMEI